MTTKQTFSTDEWIILRALPSLAGAATLLAGSSGLGTMKESFALAKGIVQGLQSPTYLIRDLSQREEVQAAQDALKDVLGGHGKTQATAEVRTRALDTARQAVTLLEQKATPEESRAVREWIYQLAQDVAEASKEGGFLGIGGQRISTEEQAFLAELRTALQL